MKPLAVVRRTPGYRLTYGTVGLTGARISAVAAGIDATRSNPMRALFATPGVIIGVAALVAGLSLGDGMELMARTGARLSRRRIADAGSLEEEVPAAAGVSLVVSGVATIEDPETEMR